VNPPDRDTPNPNRFAETVDLTAVNLPSVQALQSGDFETSQPKDHNAQRVAFVQGSDDPSEHFRYLLQARLRSAAFLIVIGMSLWLVRSWVVGDPGLVSLEVGVIATEGVVVALLSGRRAWSTRQLRILEALVFGLALLDISAEQYHEMTRRIEAGDAAVQRALDAREIADPGSVHAALHASAQLVASVKTTITFVVLLMIVYGLLIPNAWHRTAIVVLFFVGVTGAVQLAVLLRTADHLLLVEEVATSEMTSENVITFAIGAIIAVFGSYVVNALRLEAFEARQLGQYVLRRRLGGGGMGDVYFAEHRLLKRPCAIKLIRPERAGDPNALRRFEREVRSTAMLSHWNTIEIYDYGRTEDGTFYYVMEHLMGLTFAELVERHGPLPPGRAVYLLRQACDSLAEAHAAGLVHRDLKPANVFAARRGGQCDVAKVLDFGLVKSTAADSFPDPARAGTVTGTPLYMSPEQAGADPRLDARSDLYSLGAVAYFLVTGRPPHEGSTSRAVMIAVVRDPPAPPSGSRPEIPEDLEGVIMRCLAKAPSARYASARELRDALLACACAGDWNEDRAADWWRLHEPERVGFEPPSISQRAASQTATSSSTAS